MQYLRRVKNFTHLLKLLLKLYWLHNQTPNQDLSKPDWTVRALDRLAYELGRVAVGLPNGKGYDDFKTTLSLLAESIKVLSGNAVDEADKATILQLVLALVKHADLKVLVIEN